jgi:hypothetical protein
MRYFGGGMGHQNQENRWTINKRVEEYDNDMEVDDSEEENIGPNEDVETNPNLQLQELQKLASDLTSAPGEESDMDVDSDDDDSDRDSAKDADEDNLLADYIDNSDDNSDDSDEIDFGPEDGYGEENEGSFAEF